MMLYLRLTWLRVLEAQWLGVDTGTGFALERPHWRKHHKGRSGVCERGLSHGEEARDQGSGCLFSNNSLVITMQGAHK